MFSKSDYDKIGKSISAHVHIIFLVKAPWKTENYNIMLSHVYSQVSQLLSDISSLQIVITYIIKCPEAVGTRPNNYRAQFP